MAIDLSMPVLVVDDYKTMIRIIRNLLKQLGFSDIDDAADGTEALAKMQQRQYGLVISDWNMEPMTGYELLKEVRSDENLMKTPFIMVTAESKTENVIAAKKAGVNNYSHLMQQHSAPKLTRFSANNKFKEMKADNSRPHFLNLSAFVFSSRSKLTWPKPAKPYLNLGAKH